MKRRVTMRDVAAKAGVHQSSVSMALRGHPGIGKATRERIARIAEEMGYRPDPGLSALAAYRNASRPVQHHGEIGVLNHGTSMAPSPDSTDGLRLRGMRERAALHGYTITLFDLADPGMTPRSFNRILRARNIQGVIINRMDKPQMQFLRAIAWEEITAVGFGRWPLWPPVPRVEHNQYSTMRSILQRMLLRGYRRIGLVHSTSNLRGISFFPEAAYLHTLTRISRVEPHPVFYLDRRPLAELPRWAEENRLDAIVSGTPPRLLVPGDGDYDALFPGRYGYACLNLHRPDGSVAGVNQHIDGLGGRAVDVLVAQIQRGERGFPPIVSQIMTEGTWVDGATLPDRKLVRRQSPRNS